MERQSFFLDSLEKFSVEDQDENPFDGKAQKNTLERVRLVYLQALVYTPLYHRYGFDQDRLPVSQFSYVLGKTTHELIESYFFCFSSRTIFYLRLA
mgnify:CR=1 FL=1